MEFGRCIGGIHVVAETESGNYFPECAPNSMCFSYSSHMDTVF